MILIFLYKFFMFGIILVILVSEMKIKHGGYYEKIGIDIMCTNAY